MTFLLVGFSDCAEPQAGAARAALRLVGAVELWAGLWIAEGGPGASTERERLAPVYAALAHPIHQPVGLMVMPLDLDHGEFLIGYGTSHEGRVLYQERLSAALIGKQKATTRSLQAAYFGCGPTIFEEVVKRFDQTLTQGYPTTPLCRLMMEYGSDKGLGWHNYTALYAFLIESLPSSPRFIFELGIGSNNEDVPSNMGPKGVPGASLRAWRDFCPDALVYGGDVDERVLFSEDRIRTFFLDQTRPETISAVWEMIPDIRFDLFIDDGLHTPEAAANTLDRSLDRLGPNGLYILEDVPLAGADHYLEVVAARDVAGCLIRIPHPINDFDNCLIVAQRGGGPE